MRALIVGLAILAAACSADVGKNHGGGYTVEIRANGNDEVYVVAAPDGRVAAARSQNGVSTLLDAQALQQTLAAMPAPATNPRYDDHSVSIRAPGFSLQASGDGDDSDAADSGAGESAAPSDEKPAATASRNDRDRGHVTMNIGGFGLNVDADDGGPGEGDDRAHVRLTGLSAHDARRFITGADDLSPQVQAQMLTALGLSQDD